MKTKNAVLICSADVMAGFPSPADDFLEGTLDLNDYLIRRPASSFLVRASGDSMSSGGILSGDLLLVDRSLQAVHNSVVIAVVDGDLTLKRLWNTGSEWTLQADNRAFRPIEFRDGTEMSVWGVVTAVIRQLERR